MDSIADYWTWQKLLKTPSTTTAVASAPADVTAVQFAALTSRVQELENQVEILQTAIANLSKISLVQNQRTGQLHRLLLLDRDSDGNTVWDIIADQAEYHGI